MSSSSDVLTSRARIIREGARAIAAVPFDRDLREPEPVDTEALATAWHEGYEIGLAEGTARGRARTVADEAHADSRARELAGNVAKEAMLVRAQITQMGEDAEDALARTAFELAEAIIGRELEIAASPGRDGIARAVALLPADVSGRTAIARVHPEDACLLPDDPGAEFSMAINIVPDPSLSRGDCVLEFGDSRIDARLNTAVARAQEAFLGAGNANDVLTKVPVDLLNADASPFLEDGA